MILRVGIDIGSTTVKVVVLDEDDKLLFRSYERHYSGKEKTHRKLYTVLSFLIWSQVYFPEKCGADPFTPPEPPRR